MVWGTFVAMNVEVYRVGHYRLCDAGVLYVLFTHCIHILKIAVGEIPAESDHRRYRLMTTCSDLSPSVFLFPELLVHCPFQLESLIVHYHCMSHRSKVGKQAGPCNARQLTLTLPQI